MTVWPATPGTRGAPGCWEHLLLGGWSQPWLPWSNFHAFGFSVILNCSGHEMKNRKRFWNQLNQTDQLRPTCGQLTACEAHKSWICSCGLLAVFPTLQPTHIIIACDWCIAVMLVQFCTIWSLGLSPNSLCKLQFTEKHFQWSFGAETDLLSKLSPL